jgi:phosphate transport system permease protein
MKTLSRFTGRSSGLSDRLARIVITGSAMLAILSLILIFIFIGKEALPIFTSAQIQEEANIGNLFMPQPPHEGAATEYTWQPVSELPKYSLLPLLVGTLKVTIIASLIAIPLAVLAALYTAEFAPAFPVWLWVSSA